MTAERAVVPLEHYETLRHALADIAFSGDMHRDASVSLKSR